MKDLNRAGLIGLLSILCLVSCDEDDRLLSVDCDPGSVEAISVSFDVPSLNSSLPAHPNIQGFSPGDLLQLTSETGAASIGRKGLVYTLKVPSSATQTSDLVPLFTNVVIGQFNVDSDVDLRKLVGVESTIVENTHVYYENARHSYLSNPLSAVNSDNVAVDILRRAPANSRFVVVSSVWSGSRVLSYFVDPKSFLAINMLNVSGNYIHVRYICPALKFSLDRLNVPHPLLFTYVPIKYDATTSTVISDPRPLDEGKLTVSSPTH